MKHLEITATVAVADDAIAQASVVAATAAPVTEFTKALKAAVKAAGGKDTDVKIESRVASKQGPRKVNAKKSPEVGAGTTTAATAHHAPLKAAS